MTSQTESAIRRERVDEAREHAGALVAEGALVGGGAGLEVDGEEAEREGEEVGDVVSGLGQQGEGVRAQTEDEGREDVEKRERQRQLEDALHRGVRLPVTMHISIVSSDGLAGPW